MQMVISILIMHSLIVQNIYWNFAVVSFLVNDPLSIEMHIEFFANLNGSICKCYAYTALFITGKLLMAHG